MKYSDGFCKLLKELGYTHCFFVAGGNIMHLLESASNEFVCIPFVHEVSAGIAAEYFNEANRKDSSRAFVLVTAGPGLTNLVTSIAGAYLESRELLIVGGQVKSSDLKDNKIRQNGIQEIDGLSIVKSICVDTIQVSQFVSSEKIALAIQDSRNSRPGPLFIEMCLDVQGLDTEDFVSEIKVINRLPDECDVSPIIELLKKKKRPVLLIGGGVSRDCATELQPLLKNLPFPVMTTWNGADRIDSRNLNYMGRPNTWGQRYSNVILQQSDFLIAVGTRLGLQQTGFNWQSFLPVGQILQVDIDVNELKKQTPKIDFAVHEDADRFLTNLVNRFEIGSSELWNEWLGFAKLVKNRLPLSEDANKRSIDFVNSYDFFLEISSHLSEDDVIVPSSSGGSETVAMQTLLQLGSNTVITNKGLASMGYGLAGAIGAAIKTNKRVLHIEGDGGFAQNLQELGTVAQLDLPIKTFILCNEGYASIRMTQRTYFKENYIGCDVNTGLGLPDWKLLVQAYGIQVESLNPTLPFSDVIIKALNHGKPVVFLVPIDPEQTYFPKITSTVQKNGQMLSSPIHLMTPELSDSISSEVFKFLSIGDS